jgi:DeoR family suf operon transcriptional repressor
MRKTSLDKRFFESTRGKIVTLLRTGERTVNDLAGALDLTDNAIRSHLLGLERDGIIESAGTVKGFRKPHAIFRLTDEARHIFPKSYDSLLNLLLSVLKERMPIRSILKDVGTAAAGNRPEIDVPLEERVDAALHALEELGGAAVSEQDGAQIVIRSEGCPFADAVREHPEVCQVAEAMVAEITGRPVTEICDRTSIPRCRFAIERPAPVL